MRDLRDLLSGSLHIERIVFAHEQRVMEMEVVDGNASPKVTNFYYSENSTECTVSPPQSPADYRIETHYYLGASANGRQLLIELPSMDAGPVDLLKLPLGGIVAARIPESDFNYEGHLLLVRPRPSSEPDWESRFEGLIHPLKDCLGLLIWEAVPGSFRWEGDQFTADYTEEVKNQRNCFCAIFGTDTPDSVKEEAKRTAALREAQHDERMARGFKGRLVRDQRGNVAEIHFDENYYRVALEYAPSAGLPAPWPHKIRKVWSPALAATGARDQKITIYAARVSDQPMDDDAFLPWKYLKEGTYARGMTLPDGGHTIADPEDAGLWHQLMEFREAQWNAIEDGEEN